MPILEPARALAAAFVAILTLFVGINGWREPVAAMEGEGLDCALPALRALHLGSLSGTRAAKNVPAKTSAIVPVQFLEDAPPELPAETPALEIPEFEPPSASDQPAPPPEALPLLARIRHSQGSPLNSETWKALPGTSPLDREAVTEGSFAELVAQLQAAATNLEKAAAQCERDEQYIRADHLRASAQRIWTDARAVQGWTKAP